jgi:hypothetical protein
MHTLFTEISDQEACSAFIDVHADLESLREKCDKNELRGANPVGFFISEFRAARKAYLSLGLANGVNATRASIDLTDRKIFKALEEITSLLDQYRSSVQRRDIAQVLKRILLNSGRGKIFYQDGVLSSDLGGFPNGTDEIKMNKRLRGSYTPSIRQLARTPQEAYELFSDQLHGAIGDRFFGYERKDRL